jgi:hypothetical protein
VPADIRDKLFQPIFTTKPAGEGTGLGPLITYDIVTQQHAGSIVVDSGSANTASLRYGCHASHKSYARTTGYCGCVSKTGSPFGMWNDKPRISMPPNAFDLLGHSPGPRRPERSDPNPSLDRG